MKCELVCANEVDTLVERGGFMICVECVQDFDDTDVANNVWRVHNLLKKLPNELGKRLIDVVKTLL